MEGLAMPQPRPVLVTTRAGETLPFYELRPMNLYLKELVGQIADLQAANKLLRYQVLGP
jgi:hypothetical protein